MHTTTFVLLICSVVALSSACCTPDKWEGGQSSIGGYADRKRHGIVKELAEVAYDSTNNRTAAFLEYLNGKESRKFKIITRYEKGASDGKLYVFDVKDEKCWTKNLTHPFRKACIPADAKQVGSYFLGLSGSGLNATGYEISGKRINAFVSVQNVGDRCVPVGESIYGQVRKVDILKTIGFINITSGIRNETVFDVPEKCQKPEVEDIPEELSREYYILAL